MQIRPNSRQIPKEKNITSNKDYNDVFYSYLQSISEFDHEKRCRYINKKMINYTKIGKALGISRQTASNRFKNLMPEGLGLVCYEEENQRYILTTLDKELAALVPLDTLQTMVAALSDNCISIYVYLFNRYIANGEKSFVFTYNQLKSFCGLGLNTRSNDYIVAGILKVLSKLKLISVELLADDETGKTFYELKWITNEISDC